MRILRYLGLAALVAFVAYGVVVGLLHYRVGRAVDQLIAQAQPFVDIQYDQIDSTLDGAIGITRLKIRPLKTNDTVRIESVMLHTPGLMFLLGLDDEALFDEIPDAFGVSVNGLHVDMNGKLMQDLDEALLDNYAHHPEIQALYEGGRGCGKTGMLTSTEWRLMGYSAFQADFKLGVRTDKERGEMAFDFNSRYADMFDMEVEATLLASNFQAKPKLKKMGLKYVDRSMTRRFAEYCAKHEGEALEAHIAGQTAFLQRMLKKNGMELTPDLIQAYQNFLRSPNELIVRMAPLEPVDPSTFHVYKPIDIPALLNMSAQAR